MEVENITNKEEALKQEVKTMKVEFLKKHGTHEKGDKDELPTSTAEALIAHNVVKEVKKGKDKEEA